MNLLRFNSITDFNDRELDSLILSGIRTVQALIVKDASTISQLTAIDVKKVRRNQEKLTKKLFSPLFNLNRMVQVQSESRYFATTGCARLDEMLRGGILSGEITELNGPSGSGKTQFVLHMAFLMAIQGKEVLFIDTDASFSAERIFIMHQVGNFDEDIEPILKRIHVYRVFSFYKLIKFLDLVSIDLKKPDGYYRNIRLIVLDSYTNPLFDLVDYKTIPKQRPFLLTILGAYNQSLRSLVMNRPDVSLMTTYHAKFPNYIRSNNSGLVLGIEDNLDGSRKITSLQCERIPPQSSCNVTLDDSGFSDIPEISTKGETSTESSLIKGRKSINWTYETQNCR